jgi:DnaJ-class molecular chaperone
MNGNYYTVLGLLPMATPAQIKAAYRRKAKRFHPDMRGGSAQVFARLSEAYAVLSHPERRRAYDESCHYRRAAEPPRQGGRASWVPRFFGNLFGGVAQAS